MLNFCLIVCFYIRLSTLYTTLPHNVIRNQLVDLIENTFRRKEAFYLACNEEHAFFASVRRT